MPNTYETQFEAFIGGFTGLNQTSGLPIFTDFETENQNQVTFVQYMGEMHSTNPIEQPFIQCNVFHTDQLTSHRLAYKLAKYLNSKVNWQVEKFKFLKFYIRQSPHPLGRTESGRYRYVFNFYYTVVEGS